MRTILMVGDFKGLQPLLGRLSGFQLVHCHSIDSLRGEWGKARVHGVLMAVRQLSPAVFELLSEARNQVPSLKWGIFVRQVNHELAPFATKNLLYFQGELAKDWGPRLVRFLGDGKTEHRKRDRQPCKGGVRVKDSEYAKAYTGQRAYGKIRNLSQNGIALVFEEVLLFPAGEFLNITFRDLQGITRTFHGQIRWKRKRDDGEIEVGIQFIAAS